MAIGTGRRLLATTAVMATCAAALVGGLRPLGAGATTTTYYFHGGSNDDGCRAQVLAGTSPPCATFDTTAPTAAFPGGSSQTAVYGGNPNQSANAPSIYWYAPFTGSVSQDLYLDWYWSTTNAETALLGDTLTITVYADPSPLISTKNPKIVQSAQKITFGTPAAPALNHTIVVLPSTCPCAVTSHLLIQVTSDTYVDSGHGNTTNYDTTATAGSFHFGPPPAPPQTSNATVAPGTQAFANYDSPPGFQTRDGANRPNAGEPSIGVDWTTGKVMYMAGTQVTQIGFDTSTVPPTATWKDVTPAQLANLSEDSILFTNNQTNRTWAEDFLLNPTCNANMAYTDSDGGSGGGPTGATTNSSWTPEQCPAAEGPDHPSVGAGPYHGAPALGATDTAEIVYYCSQNVLVVAGAECTHSTDGGLTWGAPAHIFGTGTPCDSIHGHIRVSPDGTMYVPQDNCSGHQGMAVSTDNGSSFTYSVVPDAHVGVTDPSVAADTQNTVYFGYQDGADTTGTTLPKIAVSKDHGQTWSPSVDVGSALGLKNVVFPEVIAGDPGRAAFAFLGTTTAGDYQTSSFTGVWYLYVAYTYDGGSSWQVVNATPFDPVQRGCVDNGGATGGTYVGCRNMLDFNDISVDAQGRVYVAYTDGCTTDPTNTYSCDTNPAITNPKVSDGCATTPAGTYSEGASEYSTATCTYGRQAAVVRQVCGTGLFARHDPGFFEGPTCRSAPVSTPEVPFAAGLVLGGGAIAVFMGMVTRRRRTQAGGRVQRRLT
ncbi:MAG: sialidase family protein [Candidatus Dormibacteria bacterium]